MGNLIYAALVIGAGILCAVVLNALFTWLQQRAHRTQMLLDDILLQAVRWPSIVLIVILSVYFAEYYFIDVPPEYSWILSPRFVESLFIVVGAWVVSSIACNLVHIYGKSLAGHADADVDDQFIHQMGIAVKYLIWFIAILILLSLWEVDITPLLAAAGIAGLAVALAAQDLLSNFFGGAIITLDRPFRMGDRVRVEGYVGEVVDIGPRSTRILTLENQYVTIPNSKITSSVVVNYSAPEPKEKIRVPVSVAYGSDLERVREILLDIGREAAAESEFILPGAIPSVYLREFGDSGIGFMLVTWARAYNTVWAATDDLNRRIYLRFSREGIVIPFPQRDVHLKKE